MAKFTFTFSGNLDRQLSQCGNIDMIAPQMLSEAAPLAVDAIKKRLAPHSTAGTTKSGTVERSNGRQMTYTWTQTGALSDSVKAEKPQKKGGVWRCDIGFDGNDAKGVPNNTKATVLEYGTKSREPHPFLYAARADCKDSINAKMQEVFNRETGASR